ncbi:hypothetical protein GCM10010123_44660 [Pilimelia anulata]|uniref:HTH cro/C1-type domain-containing protein n=1 Tax=Pilimelia anulata TaxID=53371 RepID=A0A8J3BK66_9ACTN|nr:helix-turn-helix transcriptional regulator [Pilimelia anulata]GGK09795.1 hypothetical protein GCM10010123_44660 [Pilimelia anulata]
MNTSPSSVARARRELGARLRRIRKDAGLTGRALGLLTAQHLTRISRIENGIQFPTRQQIVDWCTACGAADRIEDLTTIAANIEFSYQEWQTEARAGLRRLGGHRVNNLFRDTVHFRIHEVAIVPGLFQTEAYTRRMLDFWHRFLDDVPPDIEETLAVKQQRISWAMRPRNRIIAILNQQALEPGGAASRSTSSSSRTASRRT